jgi:TPR repeat protein
LAISSEKGHLNSQTAIASCYRIGIGVKADEYKAIEWEKKADKNSHKIAQRELYNTLKKEFDKKKG